MTYEHGHNGEWNMANLNQFVEIRNATKDIREQLSRLYGGCTVLDNSTFVCCSDSVSVSSHFIDAEIIIRNELFQKLANSIFIVEKDKHGQPVPDESLVNAHLLLNPIVDTVKDTVGYYVNNDGLLMEEKGTLVTCTKSIPESLVLELKQLLNQESMGLITASGMLFV